jgi:hypothetical protein
MEFQKHDAIITIACVALSLSVSMSASAEEPKPSSKQIGQGAGRDENLPASPNLQTRETKRVCAGSIPSGWIKIDDSWDPGSCGQPSNVVYNIWLIERYSKKPVGSTMEACKGPVPTKWILVSTRAIPGICHPNGTFDNVMTIKRAK